MNAFENWCALHNVLSLPAATADVARFVNDCAPLGIDKVWPVVREISRAHDLAGLADPASGGRVARAISEIAKIDPPRSWPKEHKATFLRLPYDLQVYLDMREKHREGEIRRAQNEAADCRKALAAMPSPVTTLLEQKKNGIQQDTAA